MEKRSWFRLLFLSLVLVMLTVGCKAKDPQGVVSDHETEDLLDGKWEIVNQETKYEDGMKLTVKVRLTLSLDVENHLFEMYVEGDLVKPQRINLFRAGVKGEWRADKDNLVLISDDKTAYVDINSMVEDEFSANEISDEKEDMFADLRGTDMSKIVTLDMDKLVVMNDDDTTTEYTRVTPHKNSSGFRYDGRTDKTDSKVSANEESRKLQYREIRNGALSETTLPTQAGNSYAASNLYDGRESTAWVIGEKNYKKFKKETEGHFPPGIMLRFDGQKLTHAVIKNGYNKSSESYYNNSRPRGITILACTDDSHLSVGTLYEGKLKDTPFAQTLKFNEINVPYDYISIIFDEESVYPGDKYGDICVNEIELYGK